LRHGDCLEILRGMPDASVDSIVTDPPYGLSFMGKRWDYDVPSEEIWRECLRVLKPGGHLLAFAGTRTQHRMAARIEDAGFEIRDMIAWVYGSGFPKSLDVSKAIDKAAGANREVVGSKIGQPGYSLTDGKGGLYGGGFGANGTGDGECRITAPATPNARQWQGWGTALKPALEPITVARKPLAGTVAANVLEHGTGALNVDGCRVESNGDKLGGGRVSTDTEGWDRPWKHDPNAVAACRERGEAAVAKAESQGRWPANLIHDGSDEINFVFSGGASDSSTLPDLNRQVSVGGRSSSPARFFYCAKASKADRDEGCEGMEERASSSMSGRRACDDVDWKADNDVTGRFVTQRRNHHPTVKPTALMRYLCRLVTPPGGTVLDPFMGSGSTGKAAVLDGFNFIGIEREAEYVEIAKARITAAEAKSELPLFAA
jgi:site-specific DNA-methyltransferase (adenine-specific)